MIFRSSITRSFMQKNTKGKGTEQIGWAKSSLSAVCEHSNSTTCRLCCIAFCRAYFWYLNGIWKSLSYVEGKWMQMHWLHFWFGQSKIWGFQWRVLLDHVAVNGATVQKHNSWKWAYSFGYLILIFSPYISYSGLGHVWYSAYWICSEF